MALKSDDFNEDRVSDAKKDPAKARKFFNDTYKSSLASGNPRFQSSILGNWGLFELYQHNHELAADLLNQAVLLDRSTSDYNSLGIDLANLGTAYVISGRIDDAIESLDEALVVQRRQLQCNNVYKDLQNLLMLCQMKNDRKKAEYYLELAYEIFNEYGDIEKIDKIKEQFRELWPSKKNTPDNYKKLALLLRNAHDSRSFESCEIARNQIEKIGNQSYHGYENLLARQCLQNAVADLIQLTLDIGNEHQSKNDDIESQKFWSIALSISHNQRATQLGLKKMLRGRIGDIIVRPWPDNFNEKPVFSICQETAGLYPPEPEVDPSRERRGEGSISSTLEMYNHWANYRPGTGKTDDIEEKISASNPHEPSLERFIVVTYSFLKEDLIIFIDHQVQQFVYKDHFRDYEFTPEKVLPSPLVCSPIYKKNIKSRIQQEIELLYSGDYDNSICALSDVLSVPDVYRAISQWSKNNNISSHDLQIIVIPEGILHKVPYAFLVSDKQTKEKIIRKFGSVTSAISPLILKWQLQKYVWYCLPFISKTSPKCLFFGSPKSAFLPESSYLWGVVKEWQSILSAFGSENTLAFGDIPASPLYTSVENIARYHQSGEIFWYAGHGFELPEHRVDATGFPAKPKMGLVLPDQLLTLDSFENGQPWNFSKNWLVVINSCLLGQLSPKGTEVEGFLSALHTVNANAVISCLWPVRDDVAAAFAKTFCGCIKDEYAKNDEFVRAKAFCNCLRSLMSSVDEKELACYCYYGAP
jgi:tetratricopeptide (TPR) repeat protein